MEKMEEKKGNGAACAWPQDIGGPRVVRALRVRPVNGKVLTTHYRLSEADLESFGVALSQGGMVKGWQRVVAAPNGAPFKEGDVVLVDISRYGVETYEPGSIKAGTEKQNPVKYYRYPIVMVDGEECMLLDVYDVKAVAEEYAVDEPSPAETAAGKGFILS